MTPLYQEFSFNSPIINEKKLNEYIVVPKKYSTYSNILHIFLLILTKCIIYLFTIIYTIYILKKDKYKCRCCEGVVHIGLIIVSLILIVYFIFIILLCWYMNWDLSVIIPYNIFTIILSSFFVVLLAVSYFFCAFYVLKIYGIILLFLFQYIFYNSVKDLWNSSNTIYYSLEQYCNYYNTIDLPEHISTFVKLLNEYIEDCESNGKTPVLNDTKYWIKYMDNKKDLSTAEREMIDNLKKC